MSRRMGIIAVLCVVVLASTGCATIMSGTSQAITINSSPPGAHVRVGDQTGTTPVTLFIPKGKDFPVVVSQGPDKRILTLHRNVEPMTFLNAIPPLWPGFIVDAATGAITKYDPGVIWVDFRAAPGTEALLTGYRH